MASSSLLPFLLLLFSATFHLSSSLFLPVSKHPNHYFTRIRLGDPPSPLSLVLDLSGAFLWLDCAAAAPTPVPSLSILCSTAGSNAQLSLASQPPPPCTLPLENPLSKLSGNGRLVSDVISLPFLDEIRAVDDFLLICAPRSLVQGMAGGATGVFGLGRASRVAPLTQLSHQLDLPLRFSLCLPSNSGDGFIFAGKSPEGVAEISGSLLYTPLIAGSGSDSSNEYHIRVKSVKISNKKLSLPPFTAKISTVDLYTKMGRRIYPTFIRAFSIAAGAANMKAVETRKPFGTCYAAAESREAAPAIDLVLQSEMVRWTIGGRNSMVEVGDGVICLGIVDGGSDLGEDEVIIGGHQLEDVLMEFDVGGGMLGFSSSLLKKGTTCSELGSYATGGSREIF